MSVLIWPLAYRCSQIRCFRASALLSTLRVVWVGPIITYEHSGMRFCHELEVMSKKIKTNQWESGMGFRRVDKSKSTKLDK